MKKFKCSHCGYLVELEELPADYICPECEASKNSFFTLPENAEDSNEMNAIIDSVIDDILEARDERIVLDVKEENRIRISDHNPAIMRINEKCINCGQCKKTCEKKVGLKYDLNRCMDPICLGCGQCVLSCPTGAMVPKYEYKDVKSMIDANDKIMVAIIAPAVKVSIGESFGIEPGENFELKLVTALKKVGFDYVFDVSFGADLTILEETSEFFKRLKEKKGLPQFTSCCPAWVKYCEVYHPELIDNLSTCKSPIGMQCAIIKSYFAEQKGFDSNKVVTVAITPCTAKKVEAREYTLNIDHVLTAHEVTLLLKEENIDLPSLNETAYDSMMGESSGAGNMFGTTGGVCESVIRTLFRLVINQNLNESNMVFEKIRGFDGVKELSIKLGSSTYNFAVVHQMENLEKLIENGQYKKYHFIEVMNCKGGCVGGGGQPLVQIPKLDTICEQRSKGLMNVDGKKAIRCAHDNEELKKLYREYLKSPLGELSEELLHTSFSDKSGLLNNKEKNNSKK